MAYTLNKRKRLKLAARVKRNLQVSRLPIPNKHKNKLAFTLAEVLITLTILGIVAAFTIPSLILNIQDQQNKVTWKMAYSIIEQATKKVLLDNGGSLKELGATGVLGSKYQPYLAYNKYCGYSTSTYGNCWARPSQNNYDSSYASGMILNNGIMILFPYYEQDSLTANYILVDTNGWKGPNVIGKDIFVTVMRSDGLGIVPISGGCSPSESNDYSGAGCSAFYLYN